MRVKVAGGYRLAQCPAGGSDHVGMSESESNDVNMSPTRPEGIEIWKSPIAKSYLWDHKSEAMRAKCNRQNVMEMTPQQHTRLT